MIIQRAGIVALLALLTGWGSGEPSRLPGEPPGIVVLRPGGLDPDDPGLRGVHLGLEEAAHAAEMLGVSLRVREIPLDPGAELAVPEGTGFVLSLLQAGELRRLQELPGVQAVILDLVTRDDALRNAACARRVFHVEASETMYRDAGAPGAVLLWSDVLHRFGADQLNDRFRRKYHAPMTGAAWAGWFGAKVAWETLARTRAEDADSVRRFLEDPTTGFDGHKGELLSFRAWDHQLRQPMYVRSGNALDQVPDDAALDRDATAALDRLGAGAGTTGCHWEGS